MRFIDRDLSDQYISSSYQDVVQQYVNTSSLVYFLDGYGYSIFGIPSSSVGQTVLTQDQTASWAHSSSFAISASWAPGGGGTSVVTASLVPITASWALNTITSSYTLISVTSSVSASWASSSISASYAISASWAPDGGTSVVTASLVPITASWAVSASWAPFTDTGTVIVTASLYEITASQAISASWAPMPSVSNSASWASSSISSSYAVSASWAPFTDTGTTIYTGSIYPITSSQAISASWAYFSSISYIADVAFLADTASVAAHADSATSASWASSSLISISASFASRSLTASYVPNLYPQTEQISASWASSSLSSSYALSASWAPFTDTGTIITTASLYQITASQAVSASWAPGGSGTTLNTGSTYLITASWATNTVSSSYAKSSDTASFVQFGSSSITLTNDDIATFASNSISSYTSQSVNIATDLSLFYTTNSGSVLGLINAGDDGIIEMGTLGNSSSVMLGVAGSGSLFSISTSDSSSKINVTAAGVNNEINIETREVSGSIHIWTAKQGSNITLENTAAFSTIDILSERINIDKAFITGSLLGTASYADSSSWAISASWAPFTDTGTTIYTGSTYPITASWAVSSSWAPSNDITAVNSASWASASYTSSHIPFNGNRLIKRSPYTAVNAGGTTLSDFIENFFFPFVPATVAISSGGTTLYETGSVQNFTIASTITANDETSFGSASIKRNGIAWNTTGSPAPLTFTFTDTNISTSFSYITYVQTNNNGSPTVINSNTKAASFIFPYLYGTSATPGLSGNSLYTAFTRQVVTEGNKTVNMSGNTVYLYFCFPNTYASLTSILDPNSFEVFSSFEYSASVPITSSGLTNNWQANYKVYRTSLVSDPNGNFQFRQ